MGNAGDDFITGGGGDDLLVGNTTASPDSLEYVTKHGVTQANDTFNFAADLGPVAPGVTIDQRTFHGGDAGDWYSFQAPNALHTFGTSYTLAVTPDMIKISAFRDVSGTPVLDEILIPKLLPPMTRTQAPPSILSPSNNLPACRRLI